MPNMKKSLTLEPIPRLTMELALIQKPHLRSGELADICGISADTLRHYERLKLLAIPRRSQGNYRLYPPETVERVRLIRRALAVGFTLAELARILKQRDQGNPPCRQVRQLLEEKLLELDGRIAEMLNLRDQMRASLADWDKRLSQVSAGEPARLLETLLVSDEMREPGKLERKTKRDKK
jgi:DNA-binding transcriptional MerR regulator